MGVMGAGTTAPGGSVPLKSPPKKEESAEPTPTTTSNPFDLLENAE